MISSSFLLSIRIDIHDNSSFNSGRTGRMGLDGVVPGTAYTLITPKDGSFAVDLVQNLRLSSQPVPPSTYVDFSD